MVIPLGPPIRCIACGWAGLFVYACTRVPLVPAIICGVFAKAPITAKRPGLDSAKRMAASTLGPMEPAPNWP